MIDRRRLLGAAALPLGARAGAPPSAGVSKTLRLAFAAPEGNFDPPQTDSSLYSTTIAAHIFEAPLTYDYLARPARLEPQTALALPAVSADFRTLTVRLRPGIYFADDPAFHAGGRAGGLRELVAEDYVYSVKRFYDPRWKSSDLYIFENARLLGMSELRQRALKDRRPFDYDTPVDGLRALDRYTLQIRLGEPDPRFVWRLADPATFGAVAREVVAFYGDDIGAHPVGTGAFRLAGWRRGSRIELERSPSHRGTVYSGQPSPEPVAQSIAQRLAGRRLPLVDRVVVDIVEEEQPRWLSFLNGGHDLLQVPPSFGALAAPNGRLAPFLARRGVRLQSALQADMGMSFFNLVHPLVGGYTPDKVALRRAIALAHDGALYIRLVRGGMAVPAESTVPPFTSGYDPTYRSEMSSHDPARARALLDLYGYADRDGDGWREQPDGRPLELRIASLTDQLSRRANEVWQRSLAAVGLRVAFDYANWPELLKKTRAGTLMMWGYAWSAQTPDGGFFLGIAYGPNAAESNDSRFALPAFDRLFERQNRLPDGAERNAVMQGAKNLMAAYMPYKAHMHRIVADIVQPGTQNYWRHPFMRDVWRFVEVGG